MLALTSLRHQFAIIDYERSLSNNIAQDADRRADKDDADRRWHMDWIDGWCGSAGDLSQTGNVGLFTNGDMDYGSLTYFLCLIPATFVVALISIFTAWFGWQLFINN